MVSQDKVDLLSLSHIHRVITRFNGYGVVSKTSIIVGYRTHHNLYLFKCILRLILLILLDYLLKVIWHTYGFSPLVFKG